MPLGANSQYALQVLTGTLHIWYGRSLVDKCYKQLLNNLVEASQDQKQNLYIHSCVKDRIEGEIPDDYSRRLFLESVDWEEVGKEFKEFVMDSGLYHGKKHGR